MNGDGYGWKISAFGSLWHFCVVAYGFNGCSEHLLGTMAI